MNKSPEERTNLRGTQCVQDLAKQPEYCKNSRSLKTRSLKTETESLKTGDLKTKRTEDKSFETFITSINVIWESSRQRECWTLSLLFVHAKVVLSSVDLSIKRRFVCLYILKFKTNQRLQNVRTLTLKVIGHCKSQNIRFEQSANLV